IAASGIVPEDGRLEAFAANLSRLVSTVPDGQAVQFELALEARRHPELLPEIRALYRRYVELVDRTLADVGLTDDDDPTLARLVFAALDGLTLQQLIFDRPDETDAAVALLRSMLADRRAAG
ncbi:MAG: TetR family transcriptional regulator C-terminal domain-containing protein, partial [Patulibacter sp.]